MRTSQQERHYADIQRTSIIISEIDERIFNKNITKNGYWQRTLMLTELWNEKKAGRYPGELSAEHILKSFTTVIMEDVNDPTYLVKRGNFYAQLGDRAHALADYEKSKTLPAPDNVLWAFCYNNELHDLEIAINALPPTGAAEGQPQPQPLVPLTIDEIKIQKFQREIALFDMQLAMTPNHAESLASKAYTFSQLAGLLQWETSVAGKVTQAYDAAIQCAPNTYLYLKRAGSHLKQNHFDAALQDIYVGTEMAHQPNMRESILKYINAILLGNYKNDAGLQNAFEKFRVEKNIREATVEAWFNALATKYQPVVAEDPSKREIRLLQQQLQEQKKAHDIQIAELRAQVASLQQGAQRVSVESPFGGSSALFVKRDVQTQTSETVTKGALKNNGKTDRESFLSIFHEYISILERDKISRSEILECAKKPLGIECASKHQQIYLNLNSMLFSDPLTAMAASNCMGFHLDDLRAAQAECINHLESFHIDHKLCEPR